MVTKGYGLIFAVLVIIALALVAPAGAADITISPGAGAIQAGVNAASNGDTIILNPGTYSENGITITGKSLTIRSASGNRADTIIDGKSVSPRIFTVTDASSLTIDNLTIQNGRSGISGSNEGYGGAIYASSGSVTVTSSTFSGCVANCGSSGDSSAGGAIYAGQGSITVTSSTFSGCSASTRSSSSSGFGAGGGAIYASSGSVMVTSSTFSGCSASGGSLTKGYGGAISAQSGSVTVTSSTFSGCSVSGSSSGSSSAGGAIYAGEGSITVTSSTFSGCSASNSSGTGAGGAIYAMWGSITVTSSTFSGCVARGDSGTGAGGAIVAVQGSITVTSSTFSGCSASSNSGYEGHGGAIYARSGSVHFCRIYASNCGTAVYGPVDASDNWWGSNTGPSSSGIGNGATATRWLVLGATAAPASITTAQTATVRANLTFNSAGTNTSGGGIYLPDGIPVQFTPAGGTVGFTHGATGSGIAGTLFSPSGTGTATITATVDDQSVTVPVTVTAGVSATSIVIDPATPATIYAGVDGNGIYKSTDHGGAWTGATTQPANKNIRALVIKPASPANLFAGTYGGGVFRSTDSGVTWAACSNTGLANLNVLSLVSNSTGGLYAGTELGVYTSIDCGTWTAVNTGLP